MSREQENRQPDFNDIEEMWWRTAAVGHGYNQTPPELLAKSNDRTLGTAMIIPEGQPNKFLLENVTYRESVSIAETASAFKWIPNWERSAEELEESSRQCRIDRAQAAGK